MAKYCPVCQTPLKETPRYGVLLDICPQCRGVWLDGGELEKVISLAREFHATFEEHPHPPPQKEHYPYPHPPEYHHYPDYHYPKKHKKKHSIFEIFEDLFD